MEEFDIVRSSLLPHRAALLALSRIETRVLKLEDEVEQLKEDLIAMARMDGRE